MRYSKLVEVYQDLERTTKKLEKRDILAKLYMECPEKDLSKVVRLSMGIVVPKEMEIGIAENMMVRIISKAYGVSCDEIVKKFKECGDLGLTAEWFAENRKIKSLTKKVLSTDMVFDNIEKLPEITGSGSQDKKIQLVSELLICAEPVEARYIIRTILGEMRIGVAHGIVRDAIAIAFGREASEVEKAWNILLDFGRVAELAKEGRLNVDIELFRPVRVQLAEPSPGLEDALSKFDNPAIEIKLDGFRAQIHKKGHEVMIFSRRMENVTKQFPEVCEWAKERVKARECIIEGEILAVDPKTGAPKPFQQLSRRIQRKYDIEKMVKDIPVKIDLFDMIYLNGESLMKKPLSERWEALKRNIDQLKNKFEIIEHIETKDITVAKKFYDRAISMGEEGVIIKNLDAHYSPGRRVGYWLKVKPIMEPLDLVIVGAEWGTGKRAKWLGSLVLGCKDTKTGKFLATGMMGSGLTEEQLDDVTKRLKKLIIEEKGRSVVVKPEIVIEVGYQEIQKSPNYPTGYALRFPRLMRIRDDKRPSDINTVYDIERLFRQQKIRK